MHGAAIKIFLYALANLCVTTSFDCKNLNSVHESKSISLSCLFLVRQPPVGQGLLIHEVF